MQDDAAHRNSGVLPPDIPGVDRPSPFPDLSLHFRISIDLSTVSVGLWAGLWWTLGSIRSEVMPGTTIFLNG